MAKSRSRRVKNTMSQCHVLAAAVLVHRQDSHQGDTNIASVEHPTINPSPNPGFVGSTLEGRYNRLPV